MSDYLKELLKKRNLINILILAILILAIPLSINLVRQQQILFSKAATDTVQLVDNACTSVQKNKKVLTCPTLTLNFVAPSEVDVVAARGFVKEAYAAGEDCPIPTFTDSKESKAISAQWKNYDQSVYITKCTKQQLDLLPNDALIQFSEINLMTYFSYTRVAQLDPRDLNSFSNDNLVILGQATGNLGEFLNRFSNDRLLNPSFGNNILSQLPLSRIKLFSCEVQAELGQPCLSNSLPTSAPTSAPTSVPTGSTCPTRPLQDIGNEELIAKCTLAEIALLSNERLQTFSLEFLGKLPNERLMKMSLDFLAKFPNARLEDFTLDFLAKFPNDRLSTFTIEFLQKFSNDRLITMSTDILKQFPETRIRTFPCEIQIQLGYQCSTQNPTQKFVKVRFAFNESDLTNPNMRTEVNYQTGGVKKDITLTDTTPGTKFIFVQFIDDKGNISKGNPFPFKIDLVRSGPLVSGFACEVDIVNSSDLLFKFTGSNFGATQGTGNITLRSNGSISKYDSWTDNAVTGRLSSPPVSATTLGTQYFATLTNSAGQKSPEQQCLVGITQISLGAKLFCRAQRNFDQDNVELVLISDKDRNQKTSEKVTIDKDGNITNIKSKLRSGDNYIACIKAPLSVRRCSNVFTVSSGTNNISINLPIGDYNGDGVINNFDKSILENQWGPMNRTKNCDVNKDGFCNSFEWSCMIHDFNASDQQILPSSPSPTPTGQSCTNPISCATTLTISANNTTPAIGGSVTFQGKLTGFDGHPIPGKIIKIVNIDTNTILGDSTQLNSQGTHNTDLNGDYLILLPVTSSTEVNVVAKFDSDGSNQPSQSQTVKISPSS